MIRVRLTPKTIRMLRRRAKELDYPDMSAFLRDFIESTASGDPVKAQGFVGRMMEKLARQAMARAQLGLPGLDEPTRGKTRGADR